MGRLFSWRRTGYTLLSFLRRYPENVAFSPVRKRVQTRRKGYSLLSLARDREYRRSSGIELIDR
jgi:hypothetical protein